MFKTIIIHAEVNSAEYQEHNKISSEPDPVSTKFIQVKKKPAQQLLPMFKIPYNGFN